MNAPTRQTLRARRPSVSGWRWIAALLALLTPLAQQRPALLDGVPMAHAGRGAAGHHGAASVATNDAPNATGPHAPDTREHDPLAHDSHAPAAPPALWCCELSAVPALATPCLVSVLVEAPVVAFVVVPIEPRHPRASRISQLRLPFATAPPASMA